MTAKLNSDLLEVTITHNLRGDASESEVKELYRRQWIALDWGRKGANTDAYSGKARTDVALFNVMRENGAAVIAAYKKATPDSPSLRLVGLVEAGVEFEEINGLLCLPLSKAQAVDSSKGFIGNLAPRQCTIQRCGNRAKGRLANYARGVPSSHSVELLHAQDVEWLVTNYLMVNGICECVWSGGRSYEDIDHAGLTPDGLELLAQTTVSISANLVCKKAAKLLPLASAGRMLYFFGREALASRCPEGITYVPIERVFSDLNQSDGGRWLINRMLAG